MKHFAFLTLLILLVACAGPAIGPVKGVLVVYEPGVDLQNLDDLLEEIQLQVTTVVAENVFDFSTCLREDFRDDLKTRRTILFVTENSLQLPDDLQMSGGIYTGEDLWAEDQVVLGIVLEFHPLKIG